VHIALLRSWIRPTGRRDHVAQRNLLGPHAGPLLDGLDPRPEVSTFTVVKERITFSEPHFSHLGLAASEYAVIDIRTSKGDLQS
jgi:hypothetical protein